MTHRRVKGILNVDELVPQVFQLFRVRAEIRLFVGGIWEGSISIRSSLNLRPTQSYMQDFRRGLSRSLLQMVPRSTKTSISIIHCRRGVSDVEELTAFDRIKLTILLATFCISGTIWMPDEPLPTTATRLPLKSKLSCQFAE